MSSKASKKSVVTSTNIVQSSQGCTSPPVGRSPGSPLSPTRHSRLQEKEELQNLNNRLACYIEKVRHLEAENSRLRREVQLTEESRQVSNVKSMYEHELSDTRKLVDDTAKERAKLEIDIKRLWDGNEDLKAKLDKKIKELEAAEGNLLICETRYTDIQIQLKQSEAERKKFAERERELKAEIEKLKAALDDTRKHLEEETLTRIELENNIQTLNEELAFKDQVSQQEITELRTKRQVEISEIDGRLAEQYEANLHRSMQELRDQYEAQMRANREEIELLYENKIKNLTSHAQRNSDAATLAVEELRQTRLRIDGLNQKLNELEATNKVLNARIRDLEMLRETERAHHRENMESLESELARMREEMAHQLQEYQDLMDIKVALDLEIAAYRKLLESEEARLHITPVESRNSSVSGGRTTPSKHTPLRSGKRKRTLLQESEECSSTEHSVTGTARGDIEIAEVDPEGRFVKITNKGNKEIGLSGWKIVRKAEALETVYKFHRTAKIDAGASITVWSADIGATYEPPSNIVMKGQNWITADSMTTTLLNSDGEEMATSERKRQQLCTSLSRRRENLGSWPSEVHHCEQAEPVPTKEMCWLM